MVKRREVNRDQRKADRAKIETMRALAIGARCARIETRAKEKLAILDARLLHADITYDNVPYRN